MKRALIVYVSRTGSTERMAEYIAEGVRIAGHEAEVRNATEIISERDLSGYDAYILGSPTYHLGIPEPLQAVLTLASKTGLIGKVGGAFSCQTHPSSSTTNAASQIFAIMESRLRMRMTDLGPFDLDGGLLQTTTAVVESTVGMRAGQDYGRSVGEMLSRAEDKADRSV